MDRRPTLSLNEWAVLGLLVERARHGYELAGALRPGTSLGTVWRMDRPPVYRALERLEALGLASPRRQEPGRSGPTRTIYGPSRKGRAALRRWLATPVAHLRDVRTEFLLKLSLHQLLGSDATALVIAQRERFVEPLAALAAQPARGDIAGLWRHHSALAIDRFLVDLLP